MNKVTRILLAIGLILAVATPALAEFKFSGFYRSMFYNQEKKVTNDDKGKSEQWVDQRFRFRPVYTLNDYVSVVYFGEVDTVWGEESKGNIGDGGQVTYRTTGADGVNVETKNIFVDLKFQDTAASIGIQNLQDAFGGIIHMEDMPAVKVTQKFGNATIGLLYSKWDEDYSANTTANLTTGAVSTSTKADPRGDWDDLDFYSAEAKYKFSDNLTAGLGVYYMNDNRDDSTSNVGYTTAAGFGETELYWYGVNADAKFGNFGIDGFFMMQDGEYDAIGAGKDYDFEGMAASVKGTMKIANGDVGLRVIYFAEDDDDTDQARWKGFQGEYFWVNENQMQFLVDKYVANDGKEMYAIKDAVDQGFGLLGFVASGNHKLPQDMYLNWGVGYYMAMDEEHDDAGYDSREGDQLGYEICARFGKKFFEKVDVSLNASYADYGDFYDNTVYDSTSNDRADGTDDPDATYKAYLMVQVPF